MSEKYDNSYEDELIDEFGDKSEQESYANLDSNLRKIDERLGLQAREENYIFDDEYLEELENRNKQIDVKKEKEKKTHKLYKKVLVIGLLIIVIGVAIDFGLVLYNLNNKEENYSLKTILKNTDRSIIYNNTVENEKSTDKIPFLNINNSQITDINNEIVNLYNNYLSQNPNYFTYKYNISKDTISILIIMNYIPQGEQNYVYSFKTYNIDIDTLSLLDENQILDKYKLTKAKLYNKMKDTFEDTYHDLIYKNYITNDKSYPYNKLLIDLELSNFTSDISYYIENDKLVIYRYYNIYNNSDLTPYFNEESFKFKIS